MGSRLPVKLRDCLPTPKPGPPDPRAKRPPSNHQPGWLSGSKGGSGAAGKSSRANHHVGNEDKVLLIVIEFLHLARRILCLQYRHQLRIFIQNERPQAGQAPAVGCQRFRCKSLADRSWLMETKSVLVPTPLGAKQIDLIPNGNELI